MEARLAIEDANYLGVVLRKKLNGRTLEERLMKRSYDQFRTHCLRYGKVINDWSWQTEQGYHREYEIYVNKMIANIEMLNGKVTHVGLKLSYTKSVDERSVERVDGIWTKFLGEFFNCHPDGVGNMPCDNGVICDMCSTDKVSLEYKHYCQKYKSNRSR